MFGQMNLAQFQGLKNMPQEAQSAWDAVFPTTGDGSEEKLVGAGYKPLLYLGDQLVDGTLHWFIAEQTIPYKYEIRHVIKMAILEKDGEYKFSEETVSKII